MEEIPSPIVWDGRITGIKFSLATRQEVCTSSSSDFPISHISQLGNPFLGLPLEAGKCESCGAGEPGSCEGHFGFIELPIPIYHPSHIGELKRLLSLLCLKCLKMKNRKVKNIGVLERTLSSCCEEASQIAINDVKTTDGASYLELKLSSRSKFREGFWNFLAKYGYRYGDNFTRPLLPSEVLEMLKKLSPQTTKKLSIKGYFPQDGYILQYLPVPPNCLSVPDVSDGISIMSSDLSTTMLKKVLKQVEVIKSSRSGSPNFESHEVEANELQAAVERYLQVRGAGKPTRDIDGRFGITKELNNSSTKAWLEKMKTLFIRKGSGFSSRSVITGDAYKGVHEIGLPFEIAQKITFEERVTQHNMQYLQKLVDKNLCLTYKDGLSSYSLKEGTKGHTFLRPGQVIHRRIMDGDIVFINRPPTTHKHSLQALSVYVHEDHTVKINPLICGPLSADFDGDCVHLFYPQSLAAKAEVVELFSVEKQLLSSHTGNLNLQLSSDSMLSLKLMFGKCFFNKVSAQQLAMFVSNSLPDPALLRPSTSGPNWTALQLLQMALPNCFDCSGERHLIRCSNIVNLDFSREKIMSIMNDMVTSIFFEKGPQEVLKFFNSLQPLLMENMFSEGFSVTLEDYSISKLVTENGQNNIQCIAPLLLMLRSARNDLMELQVESQLHTLKAPFINFIIKSSAIGTLIDAKSESSINKVVQQIGFMGMQLSAIGKFYTVNLVDDMASLFQKKYPFCDKYPSEEYGLVRNGLFYGLDPFQEMVHSISAREVIVRSSRGLSEPGTLFKNLMAILRDVVICYDGTVRNVCSNSVLQFEYGAEPLNTVAAGEPVGVLAATAMSNPAYKAVLDSSPGSNSSWEMMKEIMLCKVNFKNDVSDRRVILYLNDCTCGRSYCKENTAYAVKNYLSKVSLKDTADELLIEYPGQPIEHECPEFNANLVGHIHLNKMTLNDLNLDMNTILEKCEETISKFRKKKNVGYLFKRIKFSVSDCCSCGQACDVGVPCLKFFWPDAIDIHLERTSCILADTVCPVILGTIVKGDPRVCKAKIVWISPETNSWIPNPNNNQKGELAIDVILEKEAVKQSGDGWRIVLDTCLPIIHLIDTSRTVPYAIKQVQELLGISCAFEQTVQRLSTSVSKVAKGVLIDHLILLANSMTCAGNMIGFNAGGIKSLSQSLNLQIPFTEATLYTPKRCFQRAAEKCHVDSLSSVVGSCSWGKHVAVGTGSRFDILWDTREVEMSQEKGSNVYDFLYLVRNNLKEEKADTTCLGADIDDFEMEDKEWELSPQHTNEKPIFDDACELSCDVERLEDGDNLLESKWEKVSSSSGGWGVTTDKGGWDVATEKVGTDVNPTEKGGWSNWGTHSEDLTSSGLVKNKTSEEDNSSMSNIGEPETPSKTLCTWDSLSHEGEHQQQTDRGKEMADSGSGWSGSAKSDSKAGKESSVSGWGKSTTHSEDLHSSMPPPKQSSWSGSGKLDSTAGKQSSVSGWGSSKTPSEDLPSSISPPKQSSWSAWSKEKTQSEDTPSESHKGAQEIPSMSPKGVEKSDWGAEKQSSWSGSGKSDWGSGKQSNWSGSAKSDSGAGKQSSWSGSAKSDSGAGKQTNWSDSGAGKQTNWSDSGAGKQTNWSDSGAGKQANWSDSGAGKQTNWSDSGAGKQTIWSDSGAGKQTNWSDSGAGKQTNWSDSGAGKQTNWSDSGAGKQTNWSGSGKSDSGAGKQTNWSGSSKSDVGAGKQSNWSFKANTEEKSQSNAWNAVAAEPKSQLESSDMENSELGGRTDGWGSSPKVGNGAQVQWGQKQFSAKNDFGENSRGWNSPNNNNNNSSVPDRRRIADGLLTATRQRLDMFTTEEQDILSEMEQKLRSIKRIMSQSCDAEPLPADDQSFILENVFQHHPDKDIKAGSGIDFIMVNKHEKFTETRCLYVVTTDGRKEDFSYRKCLENYVKVKCPEVAEGFIKKYFVINKPQPNRPPRAVGIGGGAAGIGGGAAGIGGGAVGIGGSGGVGGGSGGVGGGSGGVGGGSGGGGGDSEDQPSTPATTDK
ncbi:DNA-directed RNA polymerase V subunit 1 [Impatiens glandulifera]|uniref:DNA-directed RNA polymerase V subunit 1 n=1 Tax=Impatiens glandulifera TaxID=253017 RepID=UPI001FB19572|nr:DNA-directed RNA polymerase V subunit 1 [Impatiens glandulifera]